MVLDAGSNESLKASIHGAVGVLAATCALYNVAACMRRPAVHLFANSLFYAFVTVVEVAHVAHHLEARHG